MDTHERKELAMNQKEIKHFFEQARYARMSAEGNVNCQALWVKSRGRAEYLRLCKMFSHKRAWNIICDIENNYLSIRQFAKLKGRTVPDRIRSILKVTRSDKVWDRCVYALTAYYEASHWLDVVNHNGYRDIPYSKEV